MSDITYVPTLEGWLYLAITLDLFHRKIIGWAMDRWISRQLAIDALKRAFKNGCIGPTLIHHSDRGVQYASNEFQALLKANDIRCSMSRKGNCWDNAVAESFFKTIKYEWLYRFKFTSYNQLFESIEDYINWYNTERLHSSLGYLSPLEKEMNLRGFIKKVA